MIDRLYLLDGLSYKNLKVASQIVSDYFVQLHNETRTSHRITYNECCRQQSSTAGSSYLIIIVIVVSVCHRYGGW